MTGLYARWIDRWERKLATRDTNRVVRPFEWGTDWLHAIGFPAIAADPDDTPAFGSPSLFSRRVERRAPTRPAEAAAALPRLAEAKAVGLAAPAV